MKLRNDKLKPITVVYQGKKSLVYPGQIIEGPIQLSIYGLTPVETETRATISATYSPLVENNIISNFKPLNDTEVEKARNFIKNYKKDGLPSVAICILSKDSYNLIVDCIESIEHHVLYPNTKIYVFDTGTTNQLTIDYYNKKLASCKFPLTIINVGEFHFSKNYNKGLKQINEDYFLIQNNDTVALNDYVSKLMKVAILDKIGACGPRMLYKNGTIQHDGQAIYNHNSKGFTSPGHINLGKNVGDVPNGRLYTDGITCAGMLIKSSIYWEMGGLNEHYHDIFQDVELNIKIKMAGKAILCDRDSIIHHYDNTSRNAEWAGNDKKLKLKHLDYAYLFGKFNTSLKYTERVKKKFSIVTLLHNEKMYNDLLDDLKTQDCNFDFEVIALPNFNNEYQGCAEALNIGLDVSEGDYVIMCHQDLRLPKNWLSSIMENIKYLILNEIKFGVLGIAGSWASYNSDGGVVYLEGSPKVQIPGNVFKDVTEVQCLDELCLIVKRNFEFRYDEKLFNNYHSYGSDLCLNYMSKGYRNFAINSPCTHLSDGFSSLMKLDNLDYYTDSSFKLLRKWGNRFKLFRNTTARFDASECSIYYYIAKELNKRGIPLKEKVLVLN